ncbi:MAG: hypothetical protein O6942_08845 [Bacteroidetes bacterium]|nr:hypothetical protein [Bacteroidota bacterium]
MNKPIRILAYALLGTAAVIFVSYVIPPLRAIWPFFTTLPGAMQLGIGAGFFGFVLLIVSLIIERIEESDYNQSLRDD